MAAPLTKRPLIQRIGLALVCLPFALIPTFLFGRSPSTRVIAPVVFVAALSGCYLLANWILFDRPEAVKKHLPITSKEWRRQQKQFYENLPK